MINNKTKNCKVTICGSTYALVTNESEEQVIQAAQLVDTCMQELIDKASALDEKKVAVLVALRLASRIIELERQVHAQEQLGEHLIKIIDQETHI